MCIRGGNKWMEREVNSNYRIIMIQSDRPGSFSKGQVM